MACNDCNQSNPLTFDTSWWNNSPCAQSSNCDGCTSTSSACVIYRGPNLACSGIETDDSVEVALQKIDEQICTVNGNYSAYTFNCLPTWLGIPITTEGQFVDAITAYACEIATNLDTFVNTDFPNYQGEVELRFDAIEVPGITCASAGVTSLNTLNQILTKYCQKFEDIDDALDISGITWDACLTVVSPPTTLPEALQLLADQICTVNSAASALPTFNNIGSCLAAPLTSSDTLVVTVNKIKTRLCLTPTWDATDVTWGCIGAPVSATDLSEAIQNIVTRVQSQALAFPTFDGGDFTTAPTSGDPCDGITVSLATPLNQDRFVASTAGDASPGTLQAKLTAGTNVTLDFISTPGQAIINSSGGADTNEVLASNTDTTPGFLDAKINGGADSGISVIPTYNGGTEQLDLQVSVDLEQLFDLLLDQLVVGSTLYNKFCEKVAGCPSPCDAPTNVQAVAGIAVTPTSTTTTTLP